MECYACFWLSSYPYKKSSDREENVSREMGLQDADEPAYVKAYTEFLLSADFDQEHDFPIRGYYLFDLNFDDIPELGILHDSWGSMGGYFTCYYFDGKRIMPILNNRGEPVRISAYTQILADFEQKRVYLLKEMYLLQGNQNGTYGYVSEIKGENMDPCVYDILNLEVNQGSDLSSHFGTQYAGEDDFLSDPDLEDCLITQRYIEEWIDIPAEKYLELKRELIPEENSFVDLREGDLNYLGANYDDNGDLLYTDVRMGKEEIERLFRRFEASDAEKNTSEAEDAAPGDTAEELNALGLPLMEGTALLVTVTKYRYSNDQERIVQQYEYDSEGHILRYMSPDILDDSNIEFEYDADGNLLRQTCYEMKHSENDWKLSCWAEYGYGEETEKGISRTERKYDADGSLNRESFYDSGESLLKQITYVNNRISFEYEYDPLKNQSWKTIYDEQGNISVRCKEVYDDMGNQILYAEYDKDGNINIFEGYECDSYVVLYPYWSYENTYDDRGKLIRQVQYDYENHAEAISEYTYDEKGNIVKCFFSDDMATSEYEYEYDDAGNRVKDFYKDYGYDSAGNLVEIACGLTWEREYDRKNRLLKNTEYKGGAPECRYEYTYQTIGISEEDYPFDKMAEWEYYY